MKIKISEIPDEGLDVELEEKIESEEIRLLSPAKFRLRVEKSDVEVLVRGAVIADVALTCGRCLKDFVREIEAPVEAVYRPASELQAEEQHELHPGELETGFYEGDALDLDELFVEQMLLGIPIRPLCDEACKGICPACGADLNAAGCKCEVKKPDLAAEASVSERLEKLKEHFERRKK